MGTSNFYNKNANTIFAVLTSYESPILDDDGEETDETETVHPEEWECEDFIDNLQEMLKEKGYDSSNVWDNERSYPGREFAYKTLSKQYCGQWFEVKISAIIRSAYYDGANLDWEIQYVPGDGNWQEDEPDEDQIKDSLTWDGVNQGMAAMQTKNVLRWLENSRDSLITELEDVYGEVCGHKLQVSARFSNGETWYSEVK
jgi:hypothetical protein